MVGPPVFPPEESAMFKHLCSSCNRTQLIFMSQFKGVEGTPEGVRATFTCWCGAEQTTHVDLFGIPAAPASAVDHGAVATA
jgi:hypothetical protein